MTEVSLFALAQTQVSVTGGATEPAPCTDGCHLLGATLTIAAPDWTKLPLCDNGGSDAGRPQTLRNPQTLGDRLHEAGTRIDTHYGLLVSDGAHTWNLAAVSLSAPGSAPVDGFAVLSRAGELPPTNAPLVVGASAPLPACVQ